MTKVIVAQGDNQEQIAERFGQQFDVRVMTPHGMGEVLEANATDDAPPRDVSGTSDAEQGVETFIVRVIDELPEETDVLLYDLSAADRDLLEEQYDDDFLLIEDDSADTKQKIKQFLSA